MENNDQGNPFRPVTDLVHRHLPGATSDEQDRLGFVRLQNHLKARKPRRSIAGSLFGTWQGGLALAFGAVALLVVGVTTWQGQRPLTYTVQSGVEQTPGYIASAGGTPSSVLFSDGTDMELEPQARGRITSLDRQGARVVLEEGRARVKVTKRPKARWTFEAGPYTVLVTGTAFDFRWSEATQSFDLQLYSGSVIVHGPAAGEKGQALRAGQQIRATVSRRDLLIEPIQKVGAQAVAAPVRVTAVEASPAAAAPPAEEPAAPEDRRAAVRKAAPAPRSWSQRVGAGDHASVLREAQRRGLPKLLAHGSSADLAAVADAARYSHRRDLARQVLLAQRRRFAGSYDAQVAAFHLGRLAEDFAKNPRQALVWYETYLTEAPNGTWALEALRRKMIVQQKVETPARACETAKEILRRQPDGPHAEIARELCPTDRP